MDTFTELRAINKEIALLESISSLLSWDYETYMPKAGASHRGEMSSLVATYIHEKMTSPTYAAKLGSLIDLTTASSHDKKENASDMDACLREWKRDYLLANKLPTAFVEKQTMAINQAITYWIEAKKHNTFSSFLPHLETLVSLAQEKADFLGYKEHPYDALLDTYEEGVTCRFLEPLFTSLEEYLSKKIARITLPPPKKISLSLTPTSEEKYIIGCSKILALTLEKTRFDRAEHPFCMSLHPTDVRLTIHPASHDFLHSISAFMHESGHALYDQMLPQSWYGTPLCQAVSLGIHESQSRFWEVFIGQSRPFCHYLQNEFNAVGTHVREEQLYDSMNYVTPSLIRIHADEVSYILHVIIRMRIEKMLIGKEIRAKDVPAVWNEQYEKTLGIRPHNDTEGCLQDIHWAHGSFGYFPTYALGMLYAAQLFSTFSKKHPEWKKDIASGNFHAVKQFNFEHIHQYGRKFAPTTLVEKATNQKISPQFLIDYIEEKYPT